MKLKLMTGTLAAAAALVGVAPMAHAERAVVATGPGGYVVQYAPPAPMYEAVPGPREGWVWAPGHYVWRDGRYEWMQGSWMRERPGYDWREARWIQRPDGSWFLAQGEWVRGDRYSYYDRGDRRGPDGDRDRDGIRNRDDRDRDGDGVLNWRDEYPNDPSRS